MSAPVACPDLPVNPGTIADGSHDRIWAAVHANTKDVSAWITEIGPRVRRAGVVGVLLGEQLDHLVDSRVFTGTAYATAVNDYYGWVAAELTR